MSKVLTYRCPRCNGLFEASDFGEHGAICKWCGNEVGTEETVELGDQKQMLADILNDREKLLTATGIPDGKVRWANIAFCAMPFVFLLFNCITGEPIRWDFWFLLAFGIFISYSTYLSHKTAKRQYERLKQLVVSHDYSLSSLSSEVAVLRGWGESVGKARAAEAGAKGAGEREAYQCPNCKALFDEPLTDDEGAEVCPHCGHPAEECGRVKLTDDRKILSDILNDRKELEENVEVGYASPVALAMTAIPLLPYLWALHHAATGVPVRWYLVLLMIAGTVCSLLVYKTMVKGGNALYEKLKSIADEHAYSIVGMSTEIAVCRSRANDEEDDDETEDESTVFVRHWMEKGVPVWAVNIMLMWRLMGSADDEEVADALERLVDYVLKRAHVSRVYTGEDGAEAMNQVEQLVNYLWSSAVVREEYAQSERQGVTAATETSTPIADEPIIYIVPPSRCPGCNHPYTRQELDADRTVCPHCGTEIRVVDKAVRSQVQNEVRQFLTDARKSHGQVLAKGMLRGFGVVFALCLAVMFTQGVLYFFCSAWVIVWFMTCLSLVEAVRVNAELLTLYRMSRQKIYDLTELEMMIRHRATVMQEEFYKFKSNLVKQLEK